MRRFSGNSKAFNSSPKAIDGWGGPVVEPENIWPTNVVEMLSLSKPDSSGLPAKITSWSNWASNLWAYQTFVETFNPTSWDGGPARTVAVCHPTTGMMVGHDDMNFILTYHLLKTGQPYGAMSDGTNDAHALAIGAAIHAAGRDVRQTNGRYKTTIRAGHEGNGGNNTTGIGFYPQNYVNSTAKAAIYRDGLRRFVDKLVEGGCERENLCIDFNTLSNAGSRAAVSAAYPGDDYCDVVTTDNYDVFSGGGGWSSYAGASQATRILRFPGAYAWRFLGKNSDGSFTTTRPDMNWLAQFATDHGKPFGIDEWGVVSERTDDAQGLDMPLFIDAMYYWFQSGITGVPYVHPTIGTIEAPEFTPAWLVYFDALAGDGDYRIRPPGDDPHASGFVFTNASIRFLELFG